MKKRLYALLLALALLFTMLPFGGAAETAGRDGTGPAQGAQAAGVAKLIAFTFDDGPSQYTARLLDGLKARGAAATFFMTGVNGGSGIVNYTSLLTRMREEGHQLANHTYSHITPFSAQSGAVIRSETGRVESLLFQSMGGSYTDMVRTPGGALGGAVQSAVDAPIIHWSVDTLDWKYRNADTVYSNILSGAQDGAIVLLHDLYLTSVQGALRAMDTLAGRGYEFVTVAELLRRRGITPANGAVYYSAPAGGADRPAYTAPAIASAPGTDGVRVTFSAADAGVALYYTTDGSVPHLGSSKYAGPVTITKDTAFTVAGIDPYGTRTPAVTRTVSGMLPAAAPAIHYEDGLLTLSSSTEGAAIYYTTDGSAPTSAGILYTGGFVPSTTTRCIAVKPGFLDSAAVTCTLTRYGRMFTDVEAGRWYYDYVGEIVEQGKMSGTGEYTFAPAAPMTRAMMANVLYNMEGRPETAGSLPFADTADGRWYRDAVMWANASGILTGYSGVKFGPDDAVTREQLAVILHRYAQYRGYDVSVGEDTNILSYADAFSIREYAIPAMQWAVGAGLMSGTGASLNPQGSATRAEVAAVLIRFEEKVSNVAAAPGGLPEALE